LILDKELLADLAADMFNEVGGDLLVMRQDDDLVEVEVRQCFQGPRAVLGVSVADGRVNYQWDAAGSNLGESESESDAERAALEPAVGLQEHFGATISEAESRRLARREADLG